MQRGTIVECQWERGKKQVEALLVPLSYAQLKGLVIHKNPTSWLNI
jgi:hypothetical protein